MRILEQLTDDKGFRKQYRRALKDRKAPEGTAITAVLDSDGNVKVVRIPENATEREAAGLAFEAIHGRKPSDLEWTLHDSATRLRDHA